MAAMEIGGGGLVGGTKETAIFDLSRVWRVPGYVMRRGALGVILTAKRVVWKGRVVCWMAWMDQVLAEDGRYAWLFITEVQKAGLQTDYFDSQHLKTHTNSPLENRKSSPEQRACM